MVISEIIIGGIIVLVTFLLLANKGKNAKSLANRLNSAADDINEKVRDPVADGKAAIKAAEAQLDNLKTQRRKLFANNQLVLSALKTLASSSEKYHRLAMEEGKAERTANVIKLVAEKKKIDARIETTKAEIAKNEVLDQQLTTEIDRLQSRIEHAQAASSQHEVKLRFAELRADIAASAAGGTDVDSALDRLERDTQAAEAEAASYENEAARGLDLASTLTLKHAEEVSDDELSIYMKLPEKQPVLDAQPTA